MSNLQNFEDILKLIDLESKKLRGVSDAYQKLQGLIVSYDKINQQFRQNSKALEDIYNNQNNQQEKLAKSLSDIEYANREINTKLSKLFEEKTTQILKENKQFSVELSKLLEEKTDLIRKENKDFYKDLAGTIKIQLDDNKSQIKQLIENERSQIKQIFEIEFAKNTKELRQVIETEANKQTQVILGNQKIIKISLWVIGGLTLILSAISLIKSF